MASTFQIVDPDDLTTVLFDLNDSTGTNNAAHGSVKTYWGVGGVFDLGAPKLEPSTFTPTYRDGGDVYYTHAGLVDATWRQRITASSYDNLYKGVGRLAQLLRQGGVIKYVPHGSSNTRYIDFEPSSAPALLGGRDTELLKVLRMFDTPEGLDMTITRQPFLRGSELSSATNVLKNGSLLVDQNDNGNPDDWTISGSVSSANIDPTAEAWEFTIATGTATDVATQDSAAASAAPSDVWTFQFEAESDSATAKARAVIRYLDSGGSVLGSESTGTLTTLASYPQILSVTSSAAPASTDRVRVYIRVDNDDATSRVIRVRNAQLEESASASAFRVGSTVVANEPATTTTNSGGLVIPVYVQGDAPTPAKFTYTPVEAAAKVATVRVARRSNSGLRGKKYLTDYLNKRKWFQAESGTMGTDTSTAVDADGSPGSGSSVAQTTYAGTATTAKRVTIAPTTYLDCLRGTFDLWVRVKATASSIHKLQLKWSASTSSAQFSNTEVTLDLSTNGTPTSFGYWWVNLGRVYVPEDTAVSLSGLTFELWSRRTSGSGNLNWDGAAPVFVDEYMGTVEAQDGAGESQIGSDLTTPGAAITGDPAWTAGTDNDEQIFLDAANDSAGLGPNAGVQWGAGTHVVTFNAQAIVGIGGTLTYKFRVANITDNTEAATYTESPTSTRNAYKVLTFTGTAGKAYQAQAVVTTLTGSTKLSVNSITRQSALTISQNEQLHSNPAIPSTWRRNSSSQVLEVLSVSGDTPVMLQPGLNLLWINADDVPIAYHNQGENKRDRTATVAIAYAPRYHA